MTCIVVEMRNGEKVLSEATYRACLLQVRGVAYYLYMHGSPIMIAAEQYTGHKGGMLVRRAPWIARLAWHQVIAY
jgi:hypothetical protein